jgi:predicted ATPase
MRLTTVVIENYKSCKNTTLECGTNLTALIGLNAAGKTNILNAINCFSHLPSTILDNNRVPAIRLYLDDESKQKNIEIILNSIGVYISNPENSQEIHHYFDLISYYSAADFSNAPEVKDTVDLRAVSSKAQSRNRFLYDLVNTEKNNPDLFNRYTSLVGPEEMKLVDEIIIQKPTENLALPLAKVKGEQLSFNQLSEGTFRTMALLFYLLGNDGGLVLIEEPENSVHHTLLHDVVEIMKNESEHKQIIFSTHSDYVLNMMKPENVVFVDNGPEGTKTRVLTKELAEGKYKGLKSYLENEGALGDYWKEGGFDDWQ